MGNSLTQTGEKAPIIDKGHRINDLGPSDSSDTGSDVQGADLFPDDDGADHRGDTDSVGTGERTTSDAGGQAAIASDIGVDRVVSGAEIGATNDGNTVADYIEAERKNR